MIPRLLFRTCPQTPNAESEAFWDHARLLHPDWELRTYRDPLDPVDWPLTAEAWGRCQSGAQFAGLIRLEALLRHGGIYVDQDVELYRSLEPLRACRGFAAWEDTNTIPDAVLGAEADHGAVDTCLAEALRRIAKRNQHNQDWRTGPGAWSTGPGATTAILPLYAAVGEWLLLPPVTFFPYHYSEKHRRHENHGANPWTFGAHHWNASWLASTSV